MPKHKLLLPTQERLRQIFTYDAAIGTLTRTTGPRASTVAGANATNCITVTVDGRRYVAHRIIWKLVHGVEPKHLIDHVDGDPFNNKLNNLREATYTENNRNCVPYGRSKAKGVYQCRKGSTRWSARIRTPSGRTTLGTFDTIEEASAAYAAAALSLHGEFYRA